MLTVFTPTYNRAYIITHLYDSLCRQTSKDFEWVVVDDGSTDNTESLIKSFIAENRITIRYFRQSNGGKHRAINRGVSEAQGELFFIVDSDDYITDDAVAWINDTAQPILNDVGFAGVSGIRIHPDGKAISTGFLQSVIDSNGLEIRSNYMIRGDLAEVFKTDILRKFPFPEVDGERFVPEALVWFRIAIAGYLTRYVNYGIYVCEYLNDGLTASIIKVRSQSPVASTTFYSELSRMRVPFKVKLKAAINYWRFWLCSSKHKKPHIDLKWYWTFPLGVVLYLNDLRILR